MLNLNIASAEELLSLEGIGAQRASAIIKLRDEKGYITLNDIEENCIALYPHCRNCCRKKEFLLKSHLTL